MNSGNPSTLDQSKESATPLMKQYEALKAAHPDEIVLFRLGDFYEMFGEDAKIAAPVLEVALTQRQNVPMCGMPFHAADRYIAKLLKGGHRVAIAEQMEDPAAAKGIVKREVIRVISAGTVIEENLLKQKSNNFLAAVHYSKNKDAADVGLACVDISTGEFAVMVLPKEDDFACLKDELARLNPAEILFPKEMPLPPFLKSKPVLAISENEFEAEGAELPSAAKMILAYLKKMNPAFLAHLQKPKLVTQSEIMHLDQETIENLEILQNTFSGSEEKTLLEFLDATLSPMGARLLRQWLTRPLIHFFRIRERHDAVDFLLQESAKRKAMRAALKGCSDLERLSVRITSGNAGPRDMIGLKNALLKIREVKNIVQSDFSGQNLGGSSIFPDKLQNILSRLNDCPEAAGLIETALAPEPPIALDNGGVIRTGYHAELDEKRKAAETGKQWLQELEARERENTKIPILKIGYTSVFGYYFEVTKSHLSKVPQNWHRKQTLINNERYINQELKELEGKILGAEEQALRLERSLFGAVIAAVAEQCEAIRKSAQALAELDCLLAFAETAELKSLARPEMNESGELWIEEGWHPVVKEFLPAGGFVPNDVNLSDRHPIVILTGPNMAGKSTYLRQTALIVLMAQAGSFVPAKAAKIGIVDRIFTRIGSGDRLAQGESTFMVEMRETARILKCATAKSLVILDEVGRGTSTYDGISIAWAVVEHLAKLIRAKVLFATHYFELTHLAAELEEVRNFSVQAKEWQESVLFLHKIVEGPADRSYGIYVAKLAGLPETVVHKSKNMLKILEQEHRSLLKSRNSLKTNEEPDLFPEETGGR